MTLDLLRQLSTRAFTMYIRMEMIRQRHSKLVITFWNAFHFIDTGVDRTGKIQANSRWTAARTIVIQMLSYRCTYIDKITKMAKTLANMARLLGIIINKQVEILGFERIEMIYACFFPPAVYEFEYD